MHEDELTTDETAGGLLAPGERGPIRGPRVGVPDFLALLTNWGTWL